MYKTDFVSEHDTKWIASSIGFVIGESIFGNVGLTP